jgi:(1->4)-alpha-D-glucan 1-alpha-D-glucosylmutase
VVPNHMAIPVPESLNKPLWSVLLEGADSPFARWFDIDWDAEGGRILLPLLDGPLDDNLARFSVHKRARSYELHYFDHRFPVVRGTEKLPMRELLEAQHYRLADWREASTRLNYRRFCDISTLIAVRVEDPEVFAATHAQLLTRVADQAIDGLRIDHPDGLADPAGYLRDLRRDTGTAWVVVEKVLGRDEPLPPDWAAAGTTGYETLTVLNGLLVDPAGEPALNRTYSELTNQPTDFASVATEAKRLIATQVLAPEVNRLTRLLGVRLDVPHDRVRDAVVAVLCNLGVYRPFVSSAHTVEALDDAARVAVRQHPQSRAEIEAVRAGALGADEFGTRFGQTAAAIFAKGVEDTAFYRHARLLSLNEVGGDPGRFGVGLADFHQFAAALQATTPTAMTTLSTHDTKRSEDVRARLAALSERPDDWDREIRRWLPTAMALGCPDALTGYLFLQTLVGVWPWSVERATTYMEKATREAKLATSWARPNAAYDDAVRKFVARVFDDHDLLTEVALFVAALEPFGRSNSLSQKLIQLTMPGVPDTYQGCEFETFSLVDPDNRGAVDFTARAAALPLLADVKLRVTATALRLRRDHPHWFVHYTPMTARGPAADHLVAFARSSAVMSLATRFSARLHREGGWRDTTIDLPAGVWVDALSGAEHESGAIAVAEILRDAPVALLVPGASVEP